MDAEVDAGRRADAGPPPPAWPSTLPPTTELGMRRNFTIARSIIHLHSPLSHDACDGRGWVDGALGDAACLMHQRAAMCALRLDVAMLTDHAPHMNEVTLASGLWLEDGDERVMNAAGDVTAGRIVCPDGHRVLVTVGSENTLMPLGLERHVIEGDVAALEAAYDMDGAAAVDAFHAAGAVVWQAHTEGRDVPTLRTLGLDGLEIYNLHANVAPDIREENLGLPPTDFVPLLLDFTRANLRLAPDLAILSFLLPNQPSLDAWDTLLSENIRVAGSGGCDAHENTFPQALPDGERADSFRRMMMWIQNHLLVDGDTPEDVDEALLAGRMYVTFEVFGTPMGFDFVAMDGATPIEMGGDAPVGATLRVVRPSLPAGFPNDPPPNITMHLLRSTATGAVEVASGSGETLEHVTTEAGAYRVEVRMTPEHTRPYVETRADRLIHEVPWVYSNPIFVGMAP